MFQIFSLISMPGPTEWVIILVIALIIFGPGKLPEVGKGIGRAIREFRRASKGISEDISSAITDENSNKALNTKE